MYLVKYIYEIKEKVRVVNKLQSRFEHFPPLFSHPSFYSEEILANVRSSVKPVELEKYLFVQVHRFWCYSETVS